MPTVLNILADSSTKCNAGNGCEAVFNLNCPDGQPELRENYGFSQKELAKIVNGLAANLEQLCSAWRELHGNY